MAICSVCKQTVSRGTKPSQYSTTPLKKHLAKHHPSVYEEVVAKQRDAASAQPTLKQPSLQQALSEKRTWTRDDPKWKANARRLTEMVALDMEPLRVVEKEGFLRYSNGLEPRFEVPGRKWLTDNGMQTLYKDVKGAITTLLEEADWMSFTTDIWTTDCTNKSFISLTAHWINASFERKMAVLHVTEFAGSHTGANIAACMLKMLEEWDVREKVCQNLEVMKQHLKGEKNLHYDYQHYLIYFKANINFNYFIVKFVYISVLFSDTRCCP